MHAFQFFGDYRLFTICIARTHPLIGLRNSPNGVDFTNSIYMGPVSIQPYIESGEEREFLQKYLPIKNEMDLSIWIACFEMFIAKYAELIEPEMKPIISKFIHRCFC